MPGYGLWKSLETIHLAPRKQKFTDYSLNVNVAYAKHAISIDENRKDFKRVPWTPDASKATARDPHAISISSRSGFRACTPISAAPIQKMNRASQISRYAGCWRRRRSFLTDNERALGLFPDPAGPQHDEYKAGRWQYGVRDLPLADQAKGISRVIMHKSVYARFETKEVVLYIYRPDNLRCYVDFAHYYDNTLARPADLQCAADDIEAKWEKQKQPAGRQSSWVFRHVRLAARGITRSVHRAYDTRCAYN